DALDKRRQAGCEDLTRWALASVFGADNVHVGYTYPAPGRPDIDVLVATPGATVVVEVKGGRFTDPARRAAPDRVRKKTREFVDKALTQNARTITHLQAGADGLQDAKKRAVTIPNAPDPMSIIVTLDRVDPFATHLPDGGKRSDEPAAGTWLVALADLLVCTDILRHPAEFYTYAHTRAEINKVRSPLVIVENDALATWCEYRLAPDSSGHRHPQVLATSSQKIDDHYCHAGDDAERPERPSTGVPLEILRALDEALRDRPEHWGGLAQAAFAIQPKNWREFHRKLRQHGAAQSAQHLKRRDRKRARRASHSIAVGAGLTVRFTTEASPSTIDSTTLIPRRLD
ncbi:hypothetical protein, partial [Actinoplanes sp. TBRC 11911]|uniref:hypothetical protein n=1 Tax=Actinoplanes sp. TBRC 11911 TaxID=2729386 RepID=UPI001B7D496C